MTLIKNKIQYPTIRMMLQLTPDKLENAILKTCGIKASVKVIECSTLIYCLHHNSCFEIMKRLKCDFDFNVLKRGKDYIIQIK